ncbi:MAG: hypothetical protein HOQ22_13775 [Nocardioidaceae bacterium]|nr:hypothetical protein [Nocardioidaceae bacterium]
MSRRVNMPTADDLFRPTVVPDVPDSPAEHVDAPAEPKPRARGPRATSPVREKGPEKGPRTPSGRVKHDEKMTVYVTAEELLDLEHARLTLRGRGFAVDRGRLVREALAIVLADLDENGDDSALIRRLTAG